MSLETPLVRAAFCFAIKYRPCHCEARSDGAIRLSSHVEDMV